MMCLLVLIGVLDAAVTTEDDPHWTTLVRDTPERPFPIERVVRKVRRLVR
jgi:hypothetical protein